MILPPNAKLERNGKIHTYNNELIVLRDIFQEYKEFNKLLSKMKYKAPYKTIDSPMEASLGEPKFAKALSEYISSLHMVPNYIEFTDYYLSTYKKETKNIIEKLMIQGKDKGYSERELWEHQRQHVQRAYPSLIRDLDAAFRVYEYGNSDWKIIINWEIDVYHGSDMLLRHNENFYSITNFLQSLRAIDFFSVKHHNIPDSFRIIPMILSSLSKEEVCSNNLVLFGEGDIQNMFTNIEFVENGGNLLDKLKLSTNRIGRRSS